jgi:hypothetical protein
VGVLSGRCIEHYGAGEAFLPLLEVLDRCCRATGGSGLIAKLQHYAPTWLAQMPGLLGAQEHQALQQEIVGATKQRMLRELVGFLETLSQEIPLVLVLDDLHWSDTATLDAISLLAQRRDEARLLVIGTYRPVDAALTEHPIKRLRQDLFARGCCIDLPLAPFSRLELQGYLTARFPGTAVPDVVVDTVFGRTEGHPLFVTNLIDDWTAQGLIAPADERWGLPDQVNELALGIPERLRALIEHRMDALGQTAQRLLAAASAAGEEWPAALVASALDMESVAVDECCETLTAQGQMIAQAGISEWPDGTVTGRYRFLHALYRDVLYQRLAAAQRVRIHQCLAERLAAAYGEQSHSVAAELADHFELGCDYSRAVRYIDQAAENATRRYANHEAVAYLSRGLVLVERLSPVEQEETKIGLLQRRAHVRKVMDDLGGAIEDLETVLASGRARDDQELVVNTLMEISRIARWLNSRYCLAAAAEAEAISRALDDEFIKVCAQVNHARANLFFAEWRQDNVATCRSGFRIVHAAHDPIMTVGAPWVECMSSNYELARLVAEEAARIAQSLGDSFHFMQYRWLALWTLIYLGRLGELRRELDLALSVAEKNGNAFWVINYRLMLARLHEETLDFEGAREQCQHALSLCRERRVDLVTLHAHILSGKAHLGLLDSTRAYEHFSRATHLTEDSMGVADWHMYLPLHQGLAEYWLVQNDLIQAREMASKLCAHAAPPPERTYLALGHQLLAEIALAENQCEQAAAAVASALSTINGAATPSAVWQAYGLAPPQCSRPSDGSAVPLAAWRVYATAAKLCERQGRPSEAEVYRQQSRAVVQQLADSLEPSDPLRGSLIAGHQRVMRCTATVPR